MREEFFSKFRNYNNELEKILEKKDFSTDSKNLLLSMFYKLENSYNDYEIVKRKVKSKQEYLENILSNIKTCNRIELVKPNTLEFDLFKEKEIFYYVDLKMGYIKVIDNELFLLSALFELNNFKIYLNEEYNLIRNSLPYLLNTANDMNNTEVLRDFNAFSWNTNIKDIKDININLIYENLRIALSIDVIQKLQSSNEIVDLIEIVENNLSSLYGEKIAKDFMKLLFKLSIIIYTKKSMNERKRLLEEKNIIEEEFIKIKDKKTYISSIINLKRDLSKRLKELDLILNDRKLLLEEYEKRNNMLSDYHKILNLSHLSEKIQKERNKILNKIQECNKRLEPSNYIDTKEKLKEDFELLKDIEHENKLYEYINKLEILFMKDILYKKVELASTEEELINLAYQIRYYQFLPYTSENIINDVDEFKEFNKNVIRLIIKKMYKMKMLHTMSTNEEQDINIIENIFNLRTISLEEIYLELEKLKDDKYQLNIYDDKETLEKSVELILNFNKKDKIKLKRKVKLF